MDIEIFSDEIMFKNEYYGIGTLFIPVKDKREISYKLSHLRCLNPDNPYWHFDNNLCKNKSNCKQLYHDLNNFEIHFSDIDNTTSIKKLEIMKKWLKFTLNSKSSSKKIYFNLLFLDLQKIDKKYFGNKKEDIETNIYNRFYRSNIIYGCRRFFLKDRIYNVNINKIYHDNCDAKEKHPYFPISSINNIKYKNRRIDCSCNHIEFIDSNHKNSNMICESQFIQYIDLILGSVSQLLFRRSNVKNKYDVANVFYPLVERLIKKPNNKNSSYNYHDSQHISFFPRNHIKKHKDITSDEIIIDEGEFYTDFKLLKKLDLSSDNLNKWL